MSRTLKEMLAQAEVTAKHLEDYEPDIEERRIGASLRAVRIAFEDATRALQRLADAVSIARAENHSWAAIGAMVGTSAEAARQKYGRANN